MSLRPRKTRRVVITGSECTGKSTLAEAIAEHYGLAHVPEFARLYVEREGRSPSFRDVDVIARGQVLVENRTLLRNLRKANPASGEPYVPPEEGGLLILDTDLLSTIVYSHHYFGDCPDWIEGELAKRAAGLYLLAGIDVPWVPDGDQRDRGDRREEIQELFRDALRTRNLPYAELAGSQDERVAAALAAIEGLCAPCRSPTG